LSGYTEEKPLDEKENGINGDKWNCNFRRY
jgi:hypothetical protein